MILVAGAIAFLSNSAGEAGPLVVFGRGDANRAAADAWQQIPLHVAVALGFAVAGPTGQRRIARAASIAATGFMGLIAVGLALVLPSALRDRADILDLIVSAVLALLYAAALMLSVTRSHSTRPTSTNSASPNLAGELRRQPREPRARHPRSRPRR